jgi:hypothetical protein
MSRGARVFLAFALGIVASAAVVGVAALFSGGSDEAQALPACAQPATSIARPHDLPEAFPFPTGTLFTSRYRNRETHGVPQVDGRMPLDLAAATRYLSGELPRAGFTLRYEQRHPDEYYAFYEVAGYGGHFSVKQLCDGATAFSVSARPTLLGRSNAQ